MQSKVHCLPKIWSCGARLNLLRNLFFHKSLSWLDLSTKILWEEFMRGTIWCTMYHKLTIKLSQASTYPSSLELSWQWNYDMQEQAIWVSSRSSRNIFSTSEESRLPSASLPMTLSTKTLSISISFSLCSAPLCWLSLLSWPGLVIQSLSESQR